MLMLDLLSKVLILLSQQLDFILSFEQSSLKLIFFTRYHRNLILHISKIEGLLLQLLLADSKLLSFLIKVTLHLIQISVQTSNGLFQI